MSEHAGTSRKTAVRPPASAPEPTPEAVVYEAYSFACMNCGHGWEESYEIRHHRDGKGRPYVVYFVRGERVPSPLTRPSCINCDGGVLRIMRSGRVESARGGMETMQRVPPAGPVMVPPEPAGPTAPSRPRAVAPGSSGVPSALRASGATADPGPAGDVPAGSGDREHHWHLSDLMRPGRRDRH